MAVDCPRTSKIGSLYFITMLIPGGYRYVKIGISSEPEARQRSLAQSTPLDLELAAKLPGATYWDERNVHWSLRDGALKHEWFRLDVEAVAVALEVALGSKGIGDFLEELSRRPGFNENVLSTRIEVDARLGDRLRFERCRKGLTLLEAAQLSGIGAASIQATEVGSNAPTLRTIEALMRAYGAQASDLFGPPNPPPATARVNAEG